MELQLYRLYDLLPQPLVKNHQGSFLWEGVTKNDGFEKLPINPNFQIRSGVCYAFTFRNIFEGIK